MISFKVLAENQIDIVLQMMQDFYAIDNYPIDIEISSKMFQEFVRNENLGKCYLIYDDLQIVGYFTLTFIFSFEYQGRLAFLDDLFICESARGKSIGKQTIAFIKKVSPSFNIKIMYLEVEKHNHLAQNLYIANGFDWHNRQIMKLKL